jgi:hypothetical protein
LKGRGREEIKAGTEARPTRILPMTTRIWIEINNPLGLKSQMR